MSDVINYNVSIKDTEIIKKIGRLLIEITQDERISVEVREEILDKANSILEEN